ncbi:hypothetical protein BKA69DRAFT_1129891 [Paraphysoderma sedebokerense]|nr:hypothetical protein BKA69DRAFT_1129891 [Paraphysoderma sedebokerense]
MELDEQPEQNQTTQKVNPANSKRKAVTSDNHAYAEELGFPVPKFLSFIYNKKLGAFIIDRKKVIQKSMALKNLQDKGIEMPYTSIDLSTVLKNDESLKDDLDSIQKLLRAALVDKIITIKTHQLTELQKRADLKSIQVEFVNEAQAKLNEIAKKEPLGNLYDQWFALINKMSSKITEHCISASIDALSLMENPPTKKKKNPEPNDRKKKPREHQTQPRKNFKKSSSARDHPFKSMKKNGHPKSNKRNPIQKPNHGKKK